MILFSVKKPNVCRIRIRDINCTHLTQARYGGDGRAVRLGPGDVGEGRPAGLADDLSPCTKHILRSRWGPSVLYRIAAHLEKSRRKFKFHWKFVDGMGGLESHISFKSQWFITFTLPHQQIPYSLKCKISQFFFYPCGAPLRGGSSFSFWLTNTICQL